MDSCIFEGKVVHTRAEPIAHSFNYRIFMMFLKLNEIDKIFDRYFLWGTGKYSFARFRRSDHIGPEEIPIDAHIRDLVFKEAKKTIKGDIFLLTNLSYFGYCFNPISIYYCYDENEKLDVIVAEVTNTPWGETCTYVLTDNLLSIDDKLRRFQPIKKMHVSPFMSMEVDYDWFFNEPAEKLTVKMSNSKKNKTFFNASIGLKRVSISSLSLARMLIMYPLITLKIIFGIHFQALKLWLKKCPFYVHPAKRKTNT